MRKFETFEMLYGDNLSLPKSKLLLSEALETRSSQHNWEIKPHIHPRLYQLFFITTRHLVFTEAKHQQNLNSPCIILIPPTVLHGFKFEPDTTGRVLSLYDSLVDYLFKDLKNMTPILQQVQIINVFTDICTSEMVKHQLELIDAELNNDHPEKLPMLESYLKQLFLTIYRLSKTNYTITQATEPATLIHFRQFQQQIRKNGKSQTINQTAKTLKISPEYLNRICQQVSDKSASEVMQEYILDEAFKYLKYSSYSISEIAYILHFEYPNYFARFFRKLTGMTPTEYRTKSGIKPS